MWATASGSKEDCYFDFSCILSGTGRGGGDQYDNHSKSGLSDAESYRPNLRSLDIPEDSES